MKKGMIGLVTALLVATVLANPNQSEGEKKERMKPALLVIDIQNEYLPMMSQEDRDLAMRLINGAIWLFRENKYPIIRIYHTNPQYGPAPDTEAFEFPESVNIQPEDPKIIKNHGSGFKNTDLEKILREKECNTVFLCGLSAVGCVLATYHGAIERDFNVFMVKNALLSHKAEYTDFIEEICESVGFGALRLMLENAYK